MYHFVNFGAHNNTLNSTFHRNPENSIISVVPKMVKLLTQKFTKWYI